MLDKLQKSYADRIEKRVFRWIRKMAADRVARQGGPQSSYDHLLLDDRDKFFAEEFHDIKYLEVENPADLRTGPVIDGRLPNGESPTLLGYRHVSDQAAKGFMRSVIDKALKASLMTSASVFTGYLVAAGWLNFAKGLLAMPDWNLGSWVWELPVGSERTGCEDAHPASGYGSEPLDKDSALDGMVDGVGFQAMPQPP